MADNAKLPVIASEFEGADLDDIRRTRRLQQVEQPVESAPDAGFP